MGISHSVSVLSFSLYIFLNIMLLGFKKNSFVMQDYHLMINLSLWANYFRKLAKLSGLQQQLSNVRAFGIVAMDY